MASIELPELNGFSKRGSSATALHDHLLSKRKIEVPINFWEGKLWVRISAQIYNAMADYEALREAISGLMV